MITWDDKNVKTFKDAQRYFIDENNPDNPLHPGCRGIFAEDLEELQDNFLHDMFNMKLTAIRDTNKSCFQCENGWGTWWQYFYVLEE